jgi:chemotaxis protein methyltransferase CheR
LLGLCPDAGRLDIKILATDIDPVIVAKARVGRYPVEELAAIPQNLRDLAARPVPGAPKEFEIATEVKQLITFNIVNLVGDWPMKGSFDVILCRNVAIYFDKETQARLWQRFNDLLKPGGYLMIGHSERLSDAQARHFSSVGITAYRKNPNNSAAVLDRNPKDDRT